MEVLLALVLIGAIAGASVLQGKRSDPQASRWYGLALGCGLTAIEAVGRFSHDIRGRVGALEVLFGSYASGRARRSTCLTVRGLSELVWVGPESLKSRLGKAVGVDEIQAGDERFDRALYLQGEERLLRALLDAKVREHLLDAFSGRKVAKLRLGSGEMRAEFDDDIGHAHLPTRGSVRWLIALARRLQQPADVTARMAANAEQDPLPSVRRLVLRTMERTAPQDPTTRAAMERAARHDAAAEIRLHAALFLERDGWATLDELAADATIDDSVSARAIEALGEYIAFDQAARTLEKSLARDRLLTARAAVKALGWAGETYVPALVALMRRPRVAEVAASALGQTGSAAAEGPLVAALAGGTPELRAAAAAALGHVGTAESLLPLKELAQASRGGVRTAALDAIVRIRKRLSGADPGQLSLAAGADGQLALTEDTQGRVTLPASGEAE